MDIDAFVTRLADSPASAAIGDHAWVTPTVQSLHILAIAVVMSAILLTNLRALGVVGRDQPLSRLSARYLPWIWTALGVLALSGSTLIVGEPRRSLENPVFIAKMGLLAVAIVLTVAIHAPLRRDGDFWTPAARATGLRMLALVSLALWAGIIFAGRWIAYAIT